VAGAAAAAEAAGTDRLQEQAVAVDANEAVLLDVPERDRQEPGRVDVAVVGDEDDALAVSGALRLRPRPSRWNTEELAQPARKPLVELGRRWRLAGSPPGGDTAEKGRFDRAHDEAVGGRVVEEMADGLVLGRAQFDELAAAADADQEEHLPDRRAFAGHDRRDLRQLEQVLGADDGVDLDGEAETVQQPDRIERLLQMPFDAAETV